MTRKKQLRTPEEVRRELEHKGIPIAVWARANGLPPRPVYDVLAGRNRGRYGVAHKAAVLLGIKDGEINAQGAA
ncbi:DNA-binding protein [uncultured Desulfovibrio sp.]|uniref:DNA-binding protein n=1 Tax=uncultured Desulfovibrio sp. TaxID=167968 RepID=UPI00258D8FE1|nr:DNA-binding protein [uncultured Desulfovibrio sp.]